MFDFNFFIRKKFPFFFFSFFTPNTPTPQLLSSQLLKVLLNTMAFHITELPRCNSKSL